MWEVLNVEVAYLVLVEHKLCIKEKRVVPAGFATWPAAAAAAAAFVVAVAAAGCLPTVACCGGRC